MTPHLAPSHSSAVTPFQCINMLLRSCLEKARSTDAFVREALGQDPPLRLDGREVELSREVRLLVSRDVRRCRAVAVVQWVASASTAP